MVDMDTQKRSIEIPVEFRRDEPRPVRVFSLDERLNIGAILFAA